MDFNIFKGNGYLSVWENILPLFQGLPMLEPPSNFSFNLPTFALLLADDLSASV